MSYYGPARTANPVTSSSTHTWNGVAWIPNDVSVGSGPFNVVSQQWASSKSVSSHSGGTYPSLGAPQSQAADAASYLSQYEQYCVQQQQLTAQLDASVDEGERKRLVAWAEYYRRQYEYQQYYSQQNKVVKSASLPALPPHQPEATQVSASPLKQEKQKPGKQEASEPKTSHPESLKRYVQRALSKCSSAVQKAAVQKEVQAVIARKIKAGTMWTTDWDSEPEPLAEDSASEREKDRRFPSGDVSAPRAKKGRWSVKDDGSSSSEKSFSSYYGPSKKIQAVDVPVSHTPPKQSKFDAGRGKLSYSAKNDSYELNLPPNDSYYGCGKNENLANGTTKALKKSKQQLEKKKSKKSASVLVSNSKSLSGGFNVKASALKKRANRFELTSGLGVSSTSINQHAQYMGIGVIGGSKQVYNENDYEKMTVKGTCQVLEKEYLRLTGPPKSEKVRPQHILKAHLRNLKQTWNQEACDYVWICSQLKAVRQDLKVQRIVNEFSIDCYETHARIALESEDLNEFNQCQTQLWELYQVCEHKDGVSKVALKNKFEFIAYRIIYYVFLTFCNSKYEGGSSDLLNLMLTVSQNKEICNDKCVSHALKVRRAVAENDFLNFFRLHTTSPLMSSYLMDHLVPTIRFNALKTVVKSHRPNISSNFLFDVLGFTDADERAEGLDWLKSCGCVFNGDESVFLITESTVHSSNLESGKNSLI
eukprot:CAMPEP_0113328954 /NCGR_PEP_ID=MMETSP0010_2-20120614/20487_1 /TAXON_ID=216773 ORGANISM="Corethron hystrix, Strain 308" /NCGR_SAMPLE_ID=MMETSP0010_2 /ASSEMBLY_ACC=CAM_ASM_000155 /LENGTH=703 /DNA_ID=CAMNT_0000190701 /DNA_START=75 /DNA_END=2186 /DNA_ORIENTATION=- /assembly_acc=CAM_ASM_000155